jgi:CubicO group peptidase (beta-lactamase class C family)
MSAGLDYDLQASGIKQAIAEGKTTTRDIVKALSQTELGFEPGTRYRYSLCHDVLAGLVEVWSGQSFGEYLYENITAPLGMNDTSFRMPADLDRMAAMYIYDDPHTVRRLPLNCAFALTEQYESGGAGLISSAEDYALFVDALACGGVGRNGTRVLAAETVELMRTNQLSDIQLEDFHLVRDGYGYGLGVRTHMCPGDSKSLSPVGEFGWDGAAGAYVMLDPDNHLAVFYATHVRNRGNFLYDKLHPQLRDEVYRSLGLRT